MDDLYFITGNKGKFEQAKSILPEIKRIELDIAEIQELDTKKIIEAKLNEISKVNNGRFFCEDVSLEIEGLKGLPGPLIRWFLDTVKTAGIAKMAEDSGNTKAIGRITLGYNDNGKIVFFESTMRGKVVSPRGENGFGWDKLFQPEGCEKTLGEMEMAEKNQYSMRKKVLIKLKDYIDNGKRR